MNWPIDNVIATVATVTSVASAASNKVILAANTNRKAVIFMNNSTAILYLKYGGAATTANFSIKIAAGGTYEMSQYAYLGEIDGIWAAANGAVLVTEMT